MHSLHSTIPTIQPIDTNTTNLLQRGREACPFTANACLSSAQSSFSCCLLSARPQSAQSNATPMATTTLLSRRSACRMLLTAATTSPPATLQSSSFPLGSITQGRCCCPRGRRSVWLRAQHCSVASTRATTRLWAPSKGTGCRVTAAAMTGSGTTAAGWVSAFGHSTRSDIEHC